MAPTSQVPTEDTQQERLATPAAKPQASVPPKPEAQTAMVADPLPGDKMVQLDEPDGIYRVPSLDTGESRELQGRIKRLEIEMVNGDALLDAAELQANEVVFLRGVNGQAQARVFAPDGTVELQGDINGEAVVDIYAPGGRVVLGAEGDTCVNGSGRITITAAAVDIRGRVDGSPQLDVTLTHGGKLKFAELSGSARLTYRRANPADPEPAIQAGSLRAGAQLVQHNQTR